MQAKELLEQYAAGKRIFHQSDLRQIILCGADLSEADLSGANLRNANLQFTNLFAANLSAANLKGVNLNEANLQKALFDEMTIFPQGFDPIKAGACLMTSSNALL